MQPADCAGEREPLRDGGRSTVTPNQISEWQPGREILEYQQHARISAADTPQPGDQVGRNVCQLGQRGLLGVCLAWIDAKPGRMFPQPFDDHRSGQNGPTGR